MTLYSLPLFQPEKFSLHAEQSSQANAKVCKLQVMQDLEAKAEIVREQARTHAQVVSAYDRVSASLQLANSEGHMYKTRTIQLEAEAKRDASERK